MTIYVIRHAESLGNKKGKIGGANDDPPLSNQGVVQSVILLEKLAKEIKGDKKNHIISSPSIRAIQTALPLSQYFELFISLDENLAERNTGRSSGLDEKLVLEGIPTINLRQYISGVESENSILRRANNIETKITQYPEDDFFLFTHSIFSRYLIPKLEGDSSLKILLKNAEFYKINGGRK